MKWVSPHGWTALALAVLVVVLDQASKIWIVEVFQLEARGPQQVAGPLWLTMVWNRGVSFGLLSAETDFMRWALTVFGFGVAGVLAFWARKAERPLNAAWLGLIIGGAVGNAIDRIRYGAVADFFDVSRLYFPWVFNVADAAINIGVAVLIIDAVRRERAPAPR